MDAHPCLINPWPVQLVVALFGGKLQVVNQGLVIQSWHYYLNLQSLFDIQLCWEEQSRDHAWVVAALFFSALAPVSLHPID